MPISKKILDQIEKLDADQKTKELLLAILNEEDKGNYKFKDTYEKLITSYLETKSKGDENND
ncbi:MAG: hypothetical protein PHN56_04995 [Candidatus Nanoarchaeia archaeon]|nr:hypothetical protein [Candidatus Nanoarchaeia archaeon]